ncbi:MAG TPA: nucleoside hydrolase [Terriglobia bacterium]|nr:nucleoside hydrolase [Terriglobia bacterium]
MRKFAWLTVFFLVWPILLGAAAPAKKIPILLDTDIGTDIDDAFALALVVKSPELDLLGVTTVSGDTQARARLAAKLLWEAGDRSVPVAAGVPGRPLPMEQTRWADGFRSPQLRSMDAVTFLDQVLRRRAEKTTLVAIGPLTNVAALLTKDPRIGRKIKQIVLMGGSIAHGYGDDPNPVAEYNIASDPAAAQKVFSSGVSILMVPLDVTAMLQLHRPGRHRVFTQLTSLTNSLAILYELWNQSTPTLFDPMAVAMALDPGLCKTKPLAVEVDANGFTRAAQGKPPNAVVALHTQPSTFFDFYLKRVAP